MTPETILIVDDEPAILKLLKVLLTRAGHRVAACGNGEDALRLLSQAHYDLLITDAMMPIMNGFDLVRAIRANPSFGVLPILMLTRKSSSSDVQNALKAGVTDYVIKPIDEPLLVDKVGLLLKKSQVQPKLLRIVEIHGRETIATAQLQLRITSMSETGMTVRLPLELPRSLQLKIDSPIFSEIGIEIPILRMTECKADPQKDSSEFADFSYRAELSFVAMQEFALKKLRNWLQKQEIERKK